MPGVFRIVWLCALLLGVGCRPQLAPAPVRLDPDPGRIGRQRVLLLIDGRDGGPGRVLPHVREVARSAHLVIDTLDIRRRRLPARLDTFAVVALAAEDLRPLTADDAVRLKGFVADGGGLAVLYRGYHPHLRTLFGFDGATPAWGPTFAPEGGVRFVDDFIPGTEGLTLDRTEIVASSFGARVRAGVTVFLTSLDGRVPLLWTQPYGRGRVVYWNNTLLTGWRWRGLLAQTLVMAQPIAVQPLANAGILYLDDFPSALYNTALEPVRTEFGQTMSQFVVTTWWPDMLQLARDYRLRYTALTAFNYNGIVTPPATFEEWMNGRAVVEGRTVPASLYLAKEVVAQGHELGLHGYNHISLVLGNEWRSAEDMVQANRAVMRLWQVEGLPQPGPVTYVPPHNEIDSVGLAALARGVPSLKIQASLMDGDSTLGSGRTFGPDPWVPSLYDLPRVTSGYELNRVRQLQMLSLLQMNGMWTHFTHPDDVYSTPDRLRASRGHRRYRADAPPTGRESDLQPDSADVGDPYGLRNPNGLFWRGSPDRPGLLGKFREWLDLQARAYPWLTWRTAAEALPVVQRHYALRLELDSLSARRATGETVLGLRLDLPAQAPRPDVPLLLAVYRPAGSGDLPSLPPGGRVVHREQRPLARVDYLELPAHLIGQRVELALGRLTRHPVAPPADFDEVDALAAEPDPTRRLALGRNLVRRHWDNPIVLHRLARTLAVAARADDAIPVAERALQLDPAEEAVWRDLLAWYGWANRPTDALRLLQAALDRRPDDGDLRWQTAMAARATNQPLLAAETMLPLLDAPPGSHPPEPDLRRHLVTLYTGASRADLAVPHLRALLVHRPADDSARQLLIDLYRWSGRIDSAAAHQQVLVDRAPSRPDRRRTLVELYEASGQIERAAIEQRRLLDRAPADVPLRIHLAELYEWSGQVDRLLPELDTLATLQPDDPRWRWRAAVLAGTRRDVDGALRRWDQLVQQTGGQRDVLRAVAEQVLALEQIAVAAAHYERLWDGPVSTRPLPGGWSTLVPDSLVGDLGDRDRTRLIDLLGWLGQEERHLDRLSRWVALAPDRADLRFDLARRLTWRGRPDAARAQLDSLLVRAPDHLDARTLRAQLAEWDGDWLDARGDARQVRSALPGDTTVRAILTRLRRSHGTFVGGEIVSAHDRLGVSGRRLEAEAHGAVGSAWRWQAGVSAARLADGRSDTVVGAATVRAGARWGRRNRSGTRRLQTGGTVGVGRWQGPDGFGWTTPELSAETRVSGDGPLAGWSATVQLDHRALAIGALPITRRLRETRVATVLYGERRLESGRQALQTRAVSGVAQIDLRQPGDGNRLIDAGASLRYRQPVRRSMAVDLTGGVSWSDARDVRPDARPYYTPDGVATVAGGVEIHGRAGAGLGWTVGYQPVWQLAGITDGADRLGHNLGVSLTFGTGGDDGASTGGFGGATVQSGRSGNAAYWQQQHRVEMGRRLATGF